MPYISFFDMVGTRFLASSGEKDYADAIISFNKAIEEASKECRRCSLFVYSDNAYAEFEEVTDTIDFFQYVRNRLMRRHRYFSAAVDFGSLKARQMSFQDNKGTSMMFTNADAIKVYRHQSEFSGIGISLGASTVNDLNSAGKSIAYCQSIYQTDYEGQSFESFQNVMDISYENVSKSRLSYVVADYITTTAIDKKAGRYYITPIISMIKCLDIDSLDREIDDIISIISLDSVPAVFRERIINECHILLFLFALFERIFSINPDRMTKDAKSLCETVYKSTAEILNCKRYKLASIPTNVISNAHKQSLIKVVFNFK